MKEASWSSGSWSLIFIYKWQQERYSGWRQQSRGGKRSGTSIMHAAAFLFSCQIKRKKHNLPLEMLHENDKTNIKSLPRPWWKIERGMHIYFVYLLWYLGKLRLRYIKWLAQDHLVIIFSVISCWYQITPEIRGWEQQVIIMSEFWGLTRHGWVALTWGFSHGCSPKAAGAGARWRINWAPCPRCPFISHAQYLGVSGFFLFLQHISSFRAVACTFHCLVDSGVVTLMW